MTTQIAEIQIRRGTAAAWTSADTVLADGEWGKESDTGNVKLGDGVTAWAGLPYFTGEQGATGATGPQATFVDRGPILFNNTYHSGDVAVYNGGRILFNTTVTTGAGTNGAFTAVSGLPFVSAANYSRLSPPGVFYAADYGVRADGSTDDWVALQDLLILVRSLSTNSFNGFKVVAPAGTITVSKTIILPTQVTLEGAGLYSTAFKVLPNSNCDVMQPERFNSSAQATLLTSRLAALTAGNLRNAYRYSLSNCTLHGNQANQSASDYHHGFNAQTNPLLSTGTGDPDFDPAGNLSNVQFRACTGDGFFANGRSAIRLDRCIAWFNYGNGFTPTFDTQMVACQSGFNGIAGVYLNHQANQGAANKSYNNGDQTVLPVWISGSNYAVGARVIDPSNNNLYFAINPLTADVVAPSADPTNWTQITTTSPQAWGVGVYIDSGSGETTFQCDCQENSASSWYVKTATYRGVQISGCSDRPNFNNATSTQNTTNPNNYAGVVLDGCQGVVADVASTAVGSSGSHLRVVNSAQKNMVTIGSDSSGSLLTSDSTPVIASTNLVVYNGVNQTSAQAVFMNAFGDGSHGAATLDGVATVAWATLTGGNTYTMNRDGFCTTLVLNSGITLVTTGYHLFATQSMTLNGAIVNDGVSATTFTGAANVNGGAVWTFGKGGTGGTGNTAAGTAGATGGITFGAGAGGTGTGGGGGASGANISSAYGFLKSLAGLLSGVFNGNGTVTPHWGGAGGGGGGGDTTNRGGGGGAGGNHVFLSSPAVTISATGSVSAKGGNGFTPTLGNCGGGGGGAGGFLIVRYVTSFTNAGAVTLTGGLAGSGVGTGTAGAAGAAGSTDAEVVV